MKHSLTRSRFLAYLSFYLLFAAVVLCLAPFVGGESIDPARVLSDLRSEQPSWSTDTKIFIDYRIPRILLGFLVGGSLALIGSVFQVIFRNPLAAPSTLGVTAAGSVGAFISIAVPSLTFSWGPFSSVQLFALIGSGLILFLIYLIARRSQGLAMHTLLLAGVTTGIFCSALVLLIQYLARPDRLVEMTRWTMGGLDIVGYRHLAAILPFLMPGIGLLLMQMPSLNHLALGEEMALGHGIDVASVQRQSFWGGGLATAAAVSLAGPIYFVGLIVPHIVRRLTGFDHRLLLPASFLAGGAFLVACDTLARTLFAPTEMPVGVITAILGGPFFIYLLLKKR